MNPGIPKEVQDLLKLHGYELVRRGKHLVYKDVRGSMIVVAFSPRSRSSQLQYVKQEIVRQRVRMGR